MVKAWKPRNRRKMAEKEWQVKDHPAKPDRCSICLDNFQIPCQTNCGHLYCGLCFLKCWKSINKDKPRKCPLCSTRVIKLSPDSSTLTHEKDEKILLENVKEYNSVYAPGSCEPHVKLEKGLIALLLLLMRIRVLIPIVNRFGRFKSIAELILKFVLDFIPNPSVTLRFLEISFDVLLLFFIIYFTVLRPLKHRRQAKRFARVMALYSRIEFE